MLTSLRKIPRKLLSAEMQGQWDCHWSLKDRLRFLKLKSHRRCFELDVTVVGVSSYYEIKKQDAQLSQRDRAAGCVIVLAKSRRLELGDNILRTL